MSDDVERRITEGVRAALQPRRDDAEFMDRLRARMAEDAQLLARLGPWPCDLCDATPATHLTRSGFRLCDDCGVGGPTSTPIPGEQPGGQER